MKGAANMGARQAWLWRHRGTFSDSSPSGRSRLLVDVSAIIHHDAQTGIQRVVRAVWSELVSRGDIGVDVLPVYATSTHGYCYAPLDFLHCNSRSSELRPVRVRPGDRFLGLDLSAHLLPKYRRQIKAWRANGATVHLVVYDLLPIVRPSWFTPSAVANFRRWLEVLSQEADQAICISEHVAAELRQVLHQIGSRRVPQVGRLKMGADIAASVPSSGIPGDLKRQLENLRFRPAVLMVGTVEPRKGYEVALTAFDHLWRTRPTEAPDLVIVGKAGWKTSELQTRLRSHPEFGRRLRWFERMSDEGLCLLYEACRGLFVASRGEGWGLPIIEATMQRRHILARDLPVFREHGLANVSYFSDDRPHILGPLIIDLVRGAQKPAPRAKLATWSESVDGLLATLGITVPQQRYEDEAIRKAS